MTKSSQTKKSPQTIEQTEKKKRYLYVFFIVLDIIRLVKSCRHQLAKADAAGAKEFALS
jgi:hypothetical protein